MQGSPVPPTKYLIQRAPNVLVGQQYAESCVISTFQERLLLQVLSLTTYYLQELFPKVASVSSSSSNNNNILVMQSINPHFLHHLRTISNDPTTRYFQWRVQTSHTRRFLVACEFPTENSDDLKMFLHVSVHVQYQSWELKQLFSPVLQMNFLGLGLLRSWN